MVVNNEIFKIYNEINNERKKLISSSSVNKEELEQKMKEFVKNIQDNYKKKHYDYFKSNEYQNELNDLKKYLENLKNGVRDKTSKYDALYKVIAIYNSNRLDAVKLLYLKQIVDINEFSKLIGPFLVTCINNSIIRKAYEVYQFIDRYKKDVTILMVDNNEFKDDVKAFYTLISEGASKDELDKGRNDFINKYQYYFNSKEYMKKEEWLTLYLNPDGPKLVNNLNKIPMLIDIYNSDVCDYEKIYRISQILSPIKLIKLLVPYAVTYYDNDFIKKAMDVYFFVKEHEDEFELVKKDVIYLEKLENEKNDLLPLKEYAIKVISNYVNDKNIISLDEYIKQLNINNLVFNECIEACSIFNYSLYQKFLEVKEEKEIVVNNIKKNIINDLVSGIKIGYLKDGTRLTVLEFLKRIPIRDFDDTDYFDFINYYCSLLKPYISDEDISLVSRYMVDEKISNMSFKDIDTESEFSYYSIGDFVVTNEIHDYIIKYMQYHGYPLIRGIYSILLKKYINNDLEIVDEIRNSNIKVKAILGL